MYNNDPVIFNKIKINIEKIKREYNNQTLSNVHDSKDFKSA